MDVKTSVQFGFEGEWKAFSESHSEFMNRFPRLMDLVDQTFTRTIETASPIDRVVFFLGRLIVEDFMEIVLLCGNGYGVAGLKILRGMYERVVTASYLSRNPAEVDQFLDYRFVQEWKLYKRAEELYRDKPLMSPEQREEMKRRYEEVKDRFMESLCQRCGTTRPQLSWSKLDTASMALKSGGGLDKLYMSCYLFPTLQSHATVSSLFARMKATPEGGIAFDADAQSGLIDWALLNSHLLMLQAIETQNQHFSLGQDSSLQIVNEDFPAVWKKSSDAAADTTPA